MLQRLLSGDTNAINYTIEFIDIYFEELQVQEYKYKITELQIGDNDAPNESFTVD